MGNGRQAVSWIHIDDAVAALLWAIDEQKLAGPVNLTAPQPVRNGEFADTLGDVLGRPTIVPVPRFGPKILLGGELADALLFDGQRVHPTVLDADGFAFEHAELATALRAELGR